MRDGKNTKKTKSNQRSKSQQELLYYCGSMNYGVVVLVLVHMKSSIRMVHR
jgi:hypothetical protein